MRRYNWLSFVLLGALCQGCASLKSTAIARLDSNNFVGLSNGAPCPVSGQNRPFKGVPITLEVPTHLDVYVTETFYLYKGLKYDGDGNAVGPAPLKEASAACCRRNLNLQADIVKTKKVFTVDFKRPAAGSLGYTADFTDQQYFSKIQSEIDDNTIIEVADAINRVIPAFASLTAGTGTPSQGIGSQLQSKVIRGTRVVAYNRFDINSPDFEQQLEAFVNLHLNDCHGCPKPVFGEIEASPLGRLNASSTTDLASSRN